MPQFCADASTRQIMSIETTRVRELLNYIVSGIAPYADAMRRYSVTDKEIDVFVGEVLAASGSIRPLQIETVERFVSRAASIQERAKTLCRWGAEAYGRPPKSFETIPSLDCLSGDVSTLAAKISKEMRCKYSDEKLRSWHELCESRLRAFASILVTSASFGNPDYDAYGFVHKIVCGLSAKRSLFELAAMAQHIEKETFKLVDLMVAEDALVDLPAPTGPVKAVKKSKIVIVDESKSRVKADRV